MLKQEKIKLFVMVPLLIAVLCLNIWSFQSGEFAEKALAPTIPIQAEPFYENITA